MKNKYKDIYIYITVAVIFIILILITCAHAYWSDDGRLIPENESELMGIDAKALLRSICGSGEPPCRKNGCFW